MKKSIFLPVIALGLAVVLLSADKAAQKPQSADVLLGAALHQEEVEGNLEAAIAIYQEIIKKHPQNSPVAAKALFHMGLCYEKLGKQEALKAYQRLIADYPGQKEEVALAKERLAKLAKIIEPAPRKPNFRKIRTPFNIPQWSGSRLSPDGKTLAFGSGNAIWTVPIPGRVDPDLAGEPKELPGAADVLGDGLSWSGDGKWIAFSRAYSRDLRGGGTRINFRPEGAHIDVIPSSGGEPKRILVPQWVATKGDTQRRLSLSTDGKTVAFDSGGQIYVASVATADIKQLTKNGGVSPCFSPDGTKIAYFTPPIRQDNPPSRLSEVWVISANGEDPVKVSGDLRENLSLKGPTWSPDGRMIAFGRIVRTPNLRSEVCIVPVSEKGRPVASPLQIELPLFSTDFLTGWTPDNKIGLLLETPYHEYAYTVPVSGGKATQVSPLDGLASHPRWSPDGKRIFVRWNQGGLGSVPSDGGEVSVNRGHEGFLKNGFFTIYPGAGNSVSPDGKSVVFSAGTATSGPDIYTISVEGGEPKKITSGGMYPCWSPDGKWIAYLAREIIGDEERIAIIFKIPAEGGEAQKITTAPDNVIEAGLDWSPDGKTIAYFSKKADTSAGTLNLVPVAGGESREVCRVQDVRAHSDVSWSPDGQKIAFVSRGKIWVAPAAGGEPAEVKMDVDADAYELDWSPDGRKIAFSGESGMGIEFWFMENFLPPAPAAPAPVTMTARRLENPTAVAPSGEISPDGRHLSFWDWRTGDLAVRDLQTGQDRRLTTEGTEGKEGATVSQWAGWGSAWSSDSKQIAYAWFIADSGAERVELRVVGLDGAKPRVLSRYDGAREIGSFAWSPDGKHIAASVYPQNGSPRMELFSTVDGFARTLTDLKHEISMTKCFSPDSRYIAYDRLPDEMSPERDIYLMDIDSGQAIPLVHHPADDYLLGWSRDGKWLVFASDRTGALGLWVVGMSGPKTQGEPRLVKPGIDRILPVGLTREGALYYGVVRSTEDVYIADLDLTTGKVTGPPRKAIEQFEGGNFSPAYSPDGKYLAYVSRRGNSPYPTNYGNALCIRSLDTGQERVFYKEIWRLGLGYIGGVCWSSDNRFVTFGGSEGISITGACRIDLKTSEITRVIRYGADEMILGGVASLDGRYSFDALGKRENGFSQIVVRNLETGELRELYRFPRLERGITLALSPDGRWLSFINAGWGAVRSLRIMPASGGDAREVWNFGETKQGTPGGHHTWTPDGRYIVFSAPDPSDLRVWDLWRVPVEGGQPEKMGLQRRWGILSLTVRPDGRQLAFAGRGGSSMDSEVWVLENFLPQSGTLK